MNARASKVVIVLLAMFRMFLGFGPGQSAQAQQPVDHPVFQKLIGEWTGEGEITVPTVDQPIKITEKWTGEFDDEGRLVVDGSRKLGDTDQTFRWVYYYNSALELHEATYSDSSSDEEKTFQVSANANEDNDGGTISVQIPMGDTGATLDLRMEIAEGSVDSNVKIVDSAGAKVGGGKLEHKKNKPEEAEATQ